MKNGRRFFLVASCLISVSVYIYSLWYAEVNNADETVDEREK